MTRQELLDAFSRIDFAEDSETVESEVTAWQESVFELIDETDSDMRDLVSTMQELNKKLY